MCIRVGGWGWRGIHTEPRWLVPQASLPLLSRCEVATVNCVRCQDAVARPLANAHVTSLPRPHHLRGTEDTFDPPPTRTSAPRPLPNSMNHSLTLNPAEQGAQCLWWWHPGVEVREGDKCAVIVPTRQPFIYLSIYLSVSEYTTRPDGDTVPPLTPRACAR